MIRLFRQLEFTNMDVVTQTNTNSVSYIKRILSPLGVFLIMLGYPFLSMIWRYQYPVFSAEVFLIFASIFLLALLLAILTTACRPWLTNVIVSVCAILVLILQFNLLLEGLTILLAIAILLAFASGTKFQQLAYAVFTALIIGAFIDSRLDNARNNKPIAGSEHRTSEQQKSLAPVIHILMDGFIGPDGLPPQDVPQAIRLEILNFFREHGFEIYNRAYSHYSTTQDSLTRAFNFTNDDENLFTKTFLLDENFAITKNKYFQLLDRHGYDINVYQSESIDFCGAVPGAIGRCMIYNIPILETVPDNVPSHWVRLRILVSGLFNQSTLIDQFLQDRKWLTSWGVTLYQPKVIDEIGDDLEQTRSGVYFAHLLLPHTPWVYQNGCQLDYSTQAGERLQSPGLIRNSLETRAVRYLRYLPQISCALMELGRLFDRMRKLGLYDDAIIVVHGDHGSRITLHSPSIRNRDKLTPEDYRDFYSTLFAIKLPHGEYREHTETVSLNVLMQQAAMDITGKQQKETGVGLITEETPFIYLTDSIPLFRQDIDIFTQP